MDGYEATKIVFQRIQSLDPENASKIMGVLFIQDHGEKDMIRLAFGPESLVHSVILKAKKELLGLSSSSSSSPSTPSSPFGSLCFSRQNSSSSSGRPLLSGLNPKYNGVGHFLSESSSMNSSAPPFYGSGGGSEVDLIDEFQLQDQLSFLNDGCSPKDQDLDSILHNHRRSYSVSDVCFGGDQDYTNGGFGLKPCLYYAKGYCKNGSNCRFIHGEDVINGVETSSSMVGSPSKFEMMEQCQQQQVLLRSKSVQHQRLAAASQLNFLLQPQHLQAAESPRAAAAAALMMADEMHNFSRTRFERGDFGLNGGLANPVSRQIYLTFPADSTFKEEDVSNYFSTYGPVQDVRIPFQQKRMFGFVTFVYSETVKAILAKGNPHFVCDARVLVKPYKEKGKVPEKFRKQHMERGEFTGCGSPIGLETRDPCDLQLGGRMFHSTQDMLLRRKLEEQVDLQQAIELHSRRLMNLQLLDVKRSNHHRTLSLGAVIPSPTAHSPGFFNQNSILWADHNSQEAAEENGFAPNVAERGRESFSVRGEFSNGKGSAKKEENDFQLRFTSGHGTIGM